MPLTDLAKKALQFLRDEYELDPDSPSMELAQLSAEMEVPENDLYCLTKSTDGRVETGALIELERAKLIFVTRYTRNSTPPDFTAKTEDIQIIWPGDDLRDAQGEEVRPFDVTIGRLDRVLSEVVNYSREAATLDDPDRQTLKHHAEDMVAAGEAMLKNLGKVKGTPQPNAKQVEEMLADDPTRGIG